MKIININNKEYTFEFTIEASLYNECTEKVALLMSELMGAEDKEDIKAIISSIADIPQTTLSMFYAGLLEYHGVEGDGTIKSKRDAKKLLADYLKEHKDEEEGNFFGVMNLMIECMVDDDFFKLIGLQGMMTEATDQKQMKVPQDHKKKATKVTEK